MEDYEIFYYRILHAPTLEAFKQFAKENWNDLFQEKFGTIDNYVESILIKKSCEWALASYFFKQMTAPDVAKKHTPRPKVLVF